MEESTEQQATNGSSAESLYYPWIKDLESTLNSDEGSTALESYLARCNSLPLLEFIWACDGMKTLVQENPEKRDQLVLCIYKNYIINGALPILSNQVVLNIAKLLEMQFERPEVCDIPKKRQNSTGVVQPTVSTSTDTTIFDAASAEVEDYLRQIVFPHFQISVIKNNLFVYNSNSSSNNGASGNDLKLHAPWSVKSVLSSSSSSRLAKDPEAFVRAICEKLESLSIVDKSSDK